MGSRSWRMMATASSDAIITTRHMPGDPGGTTPLATGFLSHHGHFLAQRTTSGAARAFSSCFRGWQIHAWRDNRQKKGGERKRASRSGAERDRECEKKGASGVSKRVSPSPLSASFLFLSLSLFLPVLFLSVCLPLSFSLRACAATKDACGPPAAPPHRRRKGP